jgi:vanillate O-demethylase monooxygenase subunit
VFAEDRPIIESQPPGLPLEVGAEVHLPADRLSTAYRRLLRDLGCTTTSYPC